MDMPFEDLTDRSLPDPSRYSGSHRYTSRRPVPRMDGGATTLPRQPGLPVQDEQPTDRFTLDDTQLYGIYGML